MTGAAPAWLSYLALLISGIAVVVSFLSYRASGPRICLQVGAVATDPDPANRRIVATFTVVNKGRGETSIVGFHVTPYGERKPVVAVAYENVIAGPELPHRMEGHSQESWSADVFTAARQYGDGLRNKSFDPNSSWPSQMFFTVKTGSGKFVHDKSKKFDAFRLVADASPS